MFLIEYGRDGLASLPNHVHTLPPDQTYGFSIAYTTSQFRGRSVVIWFLEASPTGQSKVARRASRLCLLRLHLELQALGLIMNVVSDRPEFDHNTVDSKRLEVYLDEATKRLLKRTRFGINQEPLYGALAAYRELVSEEKRALLLEKLKDVRGQVHQRLEKITSIVGSSARGKAVTIERSDGSEGDVTVQIFDIGTVSLSGEIYMDSSTTNVNVISSVVQGNLVVAKQVIDSFKTDNKNPSLAEELGKLQNVVEELAKQLSPADQAQVSRRLKSLAEEAIAQNPDKDEVKGLNRS